VPAPSRFAAVDTGVLLALEAGDEECQEAIDRLSNVGFYFIVTETVLQELADIAQNDSDSENRSHAHNTLIQMTNFGFLAPSLTPVQMGVAEQLAQKLLENCIPHCALNDGLTVTESAYNNCRFLLTRRSGLLNIDRISILIAIVDSDLPAVVVISPKEIIEYFKAQK